MKKLLIVLLVAGLCISSASFGQAGFAVKPGLNLNGASFGIQAKQFQPFIGLRVANAKVENEYHDVNFPQDDYVLETRLHLYMPHVGAKLFLKGSDVVKPYLQATLFKPLIFGKQLDDGREDEDFKDNINSLKVWAGEIAFGSEYFFHPQFSIGGEFGLRMGNFKEKFESEDGTTTSSTKLGLSTSYVAFSLNFYFNANSAK